mgnify:FL=1
MIPALIPARGGSKGVPGKNITLVNHYPLLCYTITACQECPEIGEVYVSSDYPDIQTIARSCGAQVIDRPSYLSQDTSTDYDVIRHFFDDYHQYKKVAYMRPTTPLRDSLTISQAVNKAESLDHEFTGLRSMHEASDGPYKMFKIGSSGLCEGFFPDFNGETDYTNLPRQTFPQAYIPNGYIDIALRSTAEQDADFGTRVLPWITEPVIEIDTSHELDLLKCYLELYGHTTLDSLRHKYPNGV